MTTNGQAYPPIVAKPWPSATLGPYRLWLESSAILMFPDKCPVCRALPSPAITYTGYYGRERASYACGGSYGLSDVGPMRRRYVWRGRCGKEAPK